MLILSRRPGETLVFETENETITLHFGLRKGQIKVSISAPESVNIARGELLLERGRPGDDEQDY